MATNGPSKQFLIRGGIALGIIAVILTVQTKWFRSIFTKKNDTSTVIADARTVGEIVDADSNQNGIPDWQERLWGLDPTVLYTNGVSNKEIIEQKRAALGIPSATSTGPLSDTDRLARDLYSLTMALGQQDRADTQTLQSIAATLSNSVEIKTLANKYTLSDLKTTKTSRVTLEAYRTALDQTIKKLDISAPGIEVAITAIESGDYAQLTTLGSSVTAYTTAAKTLQKITVPIGVANYHLDLINGLAGMAESFVYLQYLDSESVRALSGIALYKNHSQMFESAVTGINGQLIRYGIL